MFIPTKSPKCTQELQPTTKTTSPLAKHEAAQTASFPAGRLSMWGHRTIQTGGPQSKMLWKNIFVG